MSINAFKIQSRFYTLDANELVFFHLWRVNFKVKSTTSLLQDDYVDRYVTMCLWNDMHEHKKLTPVVYKGDLEKMIHQRLLLGKGAVHSKYRRTKVSKPYVVQNVGEYSAQSKVGDLKVICKRCEFALRIALGDEVYSRFIVSAPPTRKSPPDYTLRTTNKVSTW